MEFHVHPHDKFTGQTFADSEFYVENECWCWKKIFTGGGDGSGGGGAF